MKKIVLLIFCSLLIIIRGVAQTNLPSAIDKDQKIYELSMVWKEVSYNYDNFNNCHGLDVDSLYMAYIPVVQNTKSDWEYHQAMCKFMANFNNRHTYVFSYPRFVDTCMSLICIKTMYKDKKVFVENIARRYSDKIQPGDEIIAINGLSAIDFFMQEVVPYVPASNEKDKIHFAMFDAPNFCHFYPENTKFTFSIATLNGIKDVELVTDRNFSDNEWLIYDYSTTDFLNRFFVDTIEKVSYIRLADCSLETSQYFQNRIAKMEKCNTIVLDLSCNVGGQSTYNDAIYNYLIQKDSIESYMSTSRLHVPVRKGQGKDYCNESIKNDSTNNYWCAQYKGTFFEDLSPMNFSGKRAIDITANFKGKVYVIIGREAGSAGEDLITMLSQDNSITFLGNKTNGCTGRPYFVSLPSGMIVMINTLQTFDFQGNDISSGFTPNYEVDFYDCYKTTEPQQLIDCLMNKINVALQKP